MSIARPGEIHAGHPLQPVILRPAKGEKLEAGDRDAAAVQIGLEIDQSRGRTLQLAGCRTGETADESEAID